MVLVAASSAFADFSYITTLKPSGNAPSGNAPSADGGQTIRRYYKGQKMLNDTGSAATILDFDAQTVTTINKSQKTYSVRPFGDLGQALDKSDLETTIDVNPTGV